MGIVEESCEYRAHWVSIRGKFVLSRKLGVGTRGEWAKETRAGCPQQRYATVESGRVQGPDRMGIIEGSVGTGFVVSVFGEHYFVEKPRVQD